MNKYRILTFSNNLFVVQTKLLWFWINVEEPLETMQLAKIKVSLLKQAAEKPKLVDISYID